VFRFSLNNEAFMTILGKSLTALFALSALIILTAAQRAASVDDFHLRIPKTVDTAELQIAYFLSGPFGGYSTYVRTAPKTWDFAIETAFEGKPASALKAIIYCPGYGIKTIHLPTLPETVSQGVDIGLEPLPQFQVSGKVLDVGQPDRFQIEVEYFAHWGNKFFGISDGRTTTFKMGATTIRNDGTFEVMLPDFSRDPIVSAYSDKGYFGIRIRDPKTGNDIYKLERPLRPGEVARVFVTERFDKEPLLLRSLK
jgi:hypothetical protein